MVCEFCVGTPRRTVGCCYHCHKELCGEHIAVGKNKIPYCPACDSAFYKPIDEILKKMKEIIGDISVKRNVEGEKLKPAIIEKILKMK